jgi:acyl-CoA thioester hydrolase
MGVVYYANYLVWFEVGRCEWLRALGWTYAEMEASGVLLPVIEVRCEYHQPARYDEEFDVQTSGALLSPVRLAFTYQVVRRLDGAVVAVGSTTHASTDMQGRPCRLPARVKELFG